MSLTTRPPLARKAAAACGAAVLLLGASACGNAGGNNANATGRTGDQGGPQSTQQGGPGGNLPGANGKVAAVVDHTAQVQGVQGQVAVTWTGTTTFTKDVSAARSAIKVGTCVVVRSDATSSGSTPAATVTASDVRITAKTNGSCSIGVRGPGGSDSQGGGPQFNGTPPEGAPSGGARPQQMMGGAVGEVTAVSSTGFTVASAMPGSATTTPVVVTVGTGTTYTTTGKAAASDIKVGACVAAVGTTDATGAVTARTIAVSQPQDGQCGGFMRFRSSDGASTNQES